MKEIKTSKQLSKSFKDTEFACHCCDSLPEDGMNPKLINLLQEIRDKVNQPITILSGYRCPKHNDEVGGAKHSQHCLGNAADITIKGKTAKGVQSFLNLYFYDKIGGMGSYNGFTHVDVREKHTRWKG